jgi:hypothetical protein
VASLQQLCDSVAITSPRPEIPAMGLQLLTLQRFWK